MSKFAIGAFVVIFDEKGRVLLSHRRNLDIWTLPGGGVDDRELPTEAAIRETREETGLKIKILDLVGVYGKSHKNELAFVFLGKVNGGKLKKSKEADKHQYFKLKKIPKNTIPKHVERIHDAARELEKPVFNQQKSLSARQLLKKLGEER